MATCRAIIPPRGNRASGSPCSKPACVEDAWKDAVMRGWYVARPCLSEIPVEGIPSRLIVSEDVVR